MLHRVCSARSSTGFAPNLSLEITPEFLESVILLIREWDWDIVDLDEAARRLRGSDFSRRFVCFTLDDGYDDCHGNALPIFRRHSAPFTVYVTTSLIDGGVAPWWYRLEKLISEHHHLTLDLNGTSRHFSAETAGAKWRIHRHLHCRFLNMPEKERLIGLRRLEEDHGCTANDSDARPLSWQRLRDIAESGLGTVGAHTVTHPVLSRLSEEEAREETERSRDIIAERLGVAPLHFAYPYGDRDAAGEREFHLLRGLEFRTAVTTRKGALFPAHLGYLCALPRISLSGQCQRIRHVKALLSGAPLALWNGFREVNAA